MSKFVYYVSKAWYDEVEVIESDTFLTDREVRKLIDERRTFCDQVDIEVREEETDEEN